MTILTLSTDIENYPSKKDRFLVRTSYMEIYNERLLDLMVYTSVCDCVIIHTIVLHNHYTAILYMYVHEWLLSRVHFDITMCTCTVWLSASSIILLSPYIWCIHARTHMHVTPIYLLSWALNYLFSWTQKVYLKLQFIHRPSLQASQSWQSSYSWGWCGQSFCG